MVAKKETAKQTAAKAKVKKETKKAEVKEAVAAKKAEVKAKVEKIAAEKPVKTKVKKVADKKATQATVKKAEPKKAAPKAAAPKFTSIFKAIEAGDLVSFKALVVTQKNKRGDFGRTPLMVISLIRSNPGLTDGSNYETKRIKGGKEVYDKMYQLLLDAKCDKNAMDDAGNTARDYNYGGILNQMLAD